MRTQDLLAKSLEIMKSAARVTDPSVKDELLAIALKFERLALMKVEAPEDEPAQHVLPLGAAILRQPMTK